MNSRELGGVKAFQCLQDRNTVSDLLSGESYTYNKTFNEDCSTAEVYNNIARDLVTGVMEGINGTLFACKFSPFSCYAPPFHDFNNVN